MEHRVQLMVFFAQKVGKLIEAHLAVLVRVQLAYERVNTHAQIKRLQQLPARNEETGSRQGSGCQGPSMSKNCKLDGAQKTYARSKADEAEHSFACHTLPAAAVVIPDRAPLRAPLPIARAPHRRKCLPELKVVAVHSCLDNPLVHQEFEQHLRQSGCISWPPARGTAARPRDAQWEGTSNVSASCSSEPASPALWRSTKSWISPAVTAYPISAMTRWKSCGSSASSCANWSKSARQVATICPYGMRACGPDAPAPGAGCSGEAAAAAGASGSMPQAGPRSGGPTRI